MAAVVSRITSRPSSVVWAFGGTVVGSTFSQSRSPQIDKLYKNNGDNTFNILDHASADFSDTTRSIGIAYGDYNNDGRLDFSVSTAITDTVLFYENTSSQSNRYFTCKLNGTASNSQGIGAWVELYTQGDKQVRYTTCGLGFLSQNTSKVHFGLNSSTSIDSLFVKWPSGWTDIYYSLEANQHKEITEGETADFRFELTSTGTEITNNVSTITLSAPESNSYKWNNDATTGSLTVNTFGIYSCSVISETGKRGLSYPIKISRIYEEHEQSVVNSIPRLDRENLVVSPNPSTGIFVLSSEAKELSIYNIHGLKILEGKLKQVDISSYPKGVYILTIGSHEERVIKKIIKL